MRLPRELPADGWPTGRRGQSSVVLIILAALVGSRALGADPNGSKPLPRFQVVEKATRGYFAKLKGYRSGELLARNQVGPLFVRLKQLGWQVKERDQIAARLLSENDSLVRQLRSSGGRRFMQKIAKMPGVYDRLDQLRKMPYGSRRLHEWMSSPGGDKLLKYMTTTRGGKALSKQIARGRNGHGFGKSTGRLYTDRDLLMAIKTSYEAELRRRARQKANIPAR